MRVETPLLVLGSGPGALVAAKVAGACGQPCLLVGHEITGAARPVELDEIAAGVLEQYGLLDVLRPHVQAAHPLTIVSCVFEQVIKQHCVADLNVGVYDRFDVVDRAARGRALHGVLTDGRSRWALRADTWIDAAALASSLSAAIAQGAAAVRDVIGR